MAKSINLMVVDLSHHNTVTSFAQVKASGIVGVIHKATQGTGMIDATYAARRKAALAAGLLWGAYHFADGSDPEKQADHFLRNAAPDGATLMALDWEPNGSNSMSLSQARDFCHAIESKLGRKCVIYSGNLAKEALGATVDPYLGGHRLWLAQYGPNAVVQRSWKAPWLWQFSDGVLNSPRKITGVTGEVDQNSYDGTPTQLASEWSGTPNPSPTVQPAAAGSTSSAPAMTTLWGRLADFMSRTKAQ